jgi:hypothetical protein
MIFILVSFVIGLIEAVIGFNSNDVFDLIGKIISVTFESVFDGLFSGFAIVTIVFIIIEHVQKTQKYDWKVKDLPELPKEGKVKISRTGTIFAIIFSVSFSIIFIMILAEYHKFIGIYAEGEMVAPFFNPSAIKIFVPLFSALLGINIIVLMLKLIDGRYTKRVTILYTVHEIVNLVLLIVFLNVASLIQPEFFTELAILLDTTASKVSNGFNIGFKSIIALSAVIVTLDLSFLWYKVIKFDKKNNV